MRGRCEPKTGIVPFMNPVTQIMSADPNRPLGEGNRVRRR